VASIPANYYPLGIVALILIAWLIVVLIGQVNR
jgi:hypothetical protein